MNPGSAKTGFAAERGVEEGVEAVKAGISATGADCEVPACLRTRFFAGVGDLGVAMALLFRLADRSRNRMVDGTKSRRESRIKNSKICVKRERSFDAGSF
jgi:hypothetical protein